MDEMKATQYIEYQVPFIFDSSNESNSTVTTSDGSGFNVSLQVPLIIPDSAVYVYLTCDRASVWNNIYNVTTANNKLHVEYDDGFIVVNHILAFEPGLYDLAHLQSALERLLNENSLPGDLFRFSPCTASEKVVIEFDYTGIQIDFTQTDTFRILLGFNSALVPTLPSTSVHQYQYGDTQASFNNVNYFLIHTDLVSRGIRINSDYTQTVALINITEAPGSQINFVAAHENPRIPANELISSKRTNIELWLTDDSNQRVDTNGQPWSVSLIIHYLAEIK